MIWHRRAGLRIALGAALVMTAVSLGMDGCASRTTVRTHDVVYPTATPTTPSVVVEQQTTTRTVEPDEPHGVLSTTVHVVGEILALPFRLVGALLRAIF